MAFQPRQYPLVNAPQIQPLSLSDLMNTYRSFQGMQDDRKERAYVDTERARVAEDRSVLQSAQSSRLPPDQVEAQLAQLGRGDLVPVFKETWSALEASRLGLKKLKDEEQERRADYLGALAAGIKRAKFEPMAVEWALTEAEADGHDVAPIREQIQARPEMLPSLVDDLIEKSPTQRKWFADEADRTLSQTREERFLQESKEREADRQADNARLERESRDREADRRADNARLAAGSPDRVTQEDRRQAEQWRATQLNDLEIQRRGKTDRLGDPINPMSQAEYEAAKDRIERAFNASLGIATPPAPPVAPRSGRDASRAGRRGATTGRGAQAPATEQVVTKAEVEAVAQRRGITVEEAERLAAAEGFLVR